MHPQIYDIQYPNHHALIQLHRAAPGAFEAGNQAEQGGLATAGGAQQAQQLPWRHLKIHPLQGPAVRGVAVAVPDPV